MLQDAGEPMTASTTGARLALHVNTARFHLEALAEAGLVIRHHEERTSPGRPNLLYAASAAAPVMADRSYRLLAEILTTYLAGQLPDPASSAVEAGRAWGKSLAEPAPPFRRPDEDEALDVLVGALGRVGFDSRAVTEPSSLRLEVSHCPFLEIAEAHEEVVCSIHLGLMRGMLEEMEAPVSADRLDPFVAPSLCVAHLSRADAAPA